MGNFAGFSKVKLTRPTRSTFDKSHNVRTSGFLGRLFPILCEECVPTDTWHGSSEMLVRLAPLLAPIYDQLRVFVHFFFVPHRILLEKWEEFITGGRMGPGSTDPVVAPVMANFDLGDWHDSNPDLCSKYSLLDYLGFPIIDFASGSYDGILIDLAPCAAYQKIWMDYYRDRNFINDAGQVSNGPPVGAGLYFPLGVGTFSFADGSNYIAGPYGRCFGHDYFSSALPFPQRGAEILIPVDGAVTYLDQSVVVKSSTDTPVTAAGYLGYVGDGTNTTPGGLTEQLSATVPPIASGDHVRIENIDSISNVSSTINDFRTAYALQVWAERNAIAGSRYSESIEAHFGLKPQDARLQRAEYIGGGVVNVKISEVVAPNYSLNDTDATIPAGNMAGHGVTYGNTNQFKYFCQEHGFIMGICSIMPERSYHQGMPKMFNQRKSFLDYPWPTFAKLGEQEVATCELFADHVTLAEDPDDGKLPLFGYQSQYADWKYSCNRNTADFHDTLLFWTLTSDFADAPVLGADFVTVPEDLSDRIFAVNDVDAAPFWLYIHHKLTVKRPLPYFGTPNTLGFV